MEFNNLIETIVNTQNKLQKKAVQAVNQSLTTRNWLIGYYIVEYEQNGSDRAKYGSNLLRSLVEKLKKKRLKGFSLQNLKLMRRFYFTYPQIGQTLSVLFKSLDLSSKNPLKSTLSSSGEIITNDQYQYSPKILLEKFSFSHFIEFMKIESPQARYFYESMALKHNWSVRHLSRQINSLLYERTGLSPERGREKIIAEANKNKLELAPKDIIKDPYCFEFLGLKDKEELFPESKLENRLLNHLQEFLLELGDGFCFEARQKRFTIDNNHYMVDLVFYHRILKCHVLIELKTRAFSHLDTGQLNFYLNYFKDTQMAPDDNPPIGIILCTDQSNKTEVKYATAGIDQQMFISKYKFALPTEEDLQKWAEQDEAIHNNDKKLTPLD